MNSNQISQNDKIKTVYGNIYTVMAVVDNMVIVYEFQGMVHIDKIVKVIR